MRTFIRGFFLIATWIPTLAIAQLTQPQIAQGKDAPVETDRAATIANAMAPKKQLRSFVLQTLRSTASSAMIVEKIGAERADAIFKSEADTAVISYGDRWTAILASAYRDTLTPAELEDAASAVAAQDQGRMMPYMEWVGPIMQQRATPLLNKVGVEALKSALEKADKK